MAIVDGLGAYAAPLLFVAALCLFIRGYVGVKMDPREPPLKTPIIPYVGHLIGMMKYQSSYIESLLAKYSDYPAVTINVLSSKIYLIQTPSLVSTSLRTKSLDFATLIVTVADRVFGTSKEGMKVIGNMTPNEKGDTYMQAVHNVMHESLRPGPGLLEMNEKVLESLVEYTNDIGVDWVEKDLYTWLRDTVTIASAASLYGPRHPFRDSEGQDNLPLIQSMWDFEHDQVSLMAGFMPWLTARKAYNGRKACQQAFRKYWDAGYNKDATAFVAGRNAVGKAWNVPDRDTANLELSIIFVATTNTVPTIFWVMCYILANPQVLADLQVEILPIVEFSDSVDGEKQATIDIAKFSTDCPLLNSTYNETLRLVNRQVSARVIKSDTVLSAPSLPEPILLKAGSIAQMPSVALHDSAAIWGPDVDTFDARRFIKRDALSRTSPQEREQKKLQTQGFIPFGGGIHLCPGRFFALAEILGMVAVWTLGYEFVDSRTGSAVQVPKQSPQRFGEAIKKPDGKTTVKVRRREGWENITWKFKVGEIDPTIKTADPYR